MAPSRVSAPLGNQVLGPDRREPLRHMAPSKSEVISSSASCMRFFRRGCGGESKTSTQIKSS
eukprot:744064-Pyramimonas_sp.AAC.1